MRFDTDLYNKAFPKPIAKPQGVSPVVKVCEVETEEEIIEVDSNITIEESNEVIEDGFTDSNTDNQ